MKEPTQWFIVLLLAPLLHCSVGHSVRISRQATWDSEIFSTTSTDSSNDGLDWNFQKEAALRFNKDKIALQKEITTLLNSVKKYELEVNIQILDGHISEAFDLQTTTLIEKWIKEYNESIKLQRKKEQSCLKCNSRDQYGNLWKVCSEDTGYRLCNEADSGQYQWRIITWNCSKEGHFLSEGPLYYGCSGDGRFYRIENELYGVNYRRRVQISVNQSRSVLEKISALLVRNDSRSTTSSKYSYYGHEIRQLLDLASDAIILIDETANYSQTEKIGEAALQNISVLLVNQDPWKELEKRERPSILTTLIQKTEEVGFNLIGRDGFAKGRNKTFYPLKNHTTDQKAILVTMGNYIRQNNDSGESVLFFSDKTFPQATSISVNLSGNFYNSSNSTENSINFVGSIVMSSYVENLFNFTIRGVPGVQLAGNSKVMNGKLLSFRLHDSSKVNQDLNVTVAFKHNVPAFGKTRITFRRRLHPGEVAKAILGETTCVYWHTSQLIWSTDGCHKTSKKSNGLVTICECDHLTSFAVLTGYHEYVGRSRGLEILTWILSSTSIICLIVAVIIFNTVHPIRSDQVKITSNLCISLTLGNILLLMGDRDNYNLSDTACTAIGMLNHCAWLCVFCWMAVEGIHLYHQVVKVFRSTNMHLFKIYYAIGYGLPCIIVAATISIGFAVENDISSYGGEMYCWLRGNYVWSFMAPVLAVVLGNFCVLFIAVRIATRKLRDKMAKSNIKTNDEQIKANKKLLQGTISLSLILGMTWCVGFFTMADYQGADILSYIFTVLNASQGIFIFIFHCVLNETIRANLSKIIVVRMSTFSRSTNSTQ